MTLALNMSAVGPCFKHRRVPLVSLFTLFAWKCWSLSRTKLSLLELQGAKRLIDLLVLSEAIEYQQTFSEQKYLLIEDTFCGCGVRATRRQPGQDYTNFLTIVNQPLHSLWEEKDL